MCLAYSTIIQISQSQNSRLVMQCSPDSSDILMQTMALRTVVFQKIIDFLLRRGKFLPDTYDFPPHIEVIETALDTIVRMLASRQIQADSRIGSHRNFCNNNFPPYNSINTMLQTCPFLVTIASIKCVMICTLSD
ncbi:hypothetical protein FHS24_001013 [Psychrobacter luti]|uniref:Uncharacterized protein n=1 Tax=Psychrobacter luti TaxID=198481 RepID=A0A839TAJ1_9GAMM|nr:hypothetical protein [Psychrobacter luti]